MGGHLFVLRGDLTQLHCSAVLIPCDSEWRVVEEHWGRFLPEGRLEKADKRGWARFSPKGEGRFTDVDQRQKRKVRLVVTAGYRGRGGDDITAQWVADGVVEAIADLSMNPSPMPAGRVKRLIGLPLVGTGAGGFKTTRGVLIDALIPALQGAARDYDVDIALVLRDQRDHAAVQAVRTKYWSDFRKEQPHLAEHLDMADELGREAANGHLSLFLGSGVSVPLGVPDWKTLLEAARGRKIDDFDPERAPEIAQEIADEFGKPFLVRKIMEHVKVGGVAPTHLLLAALSVGQTVTTNYDTAYERALDTALGENEYRVLTKELALQPHPWLLKLHGCVDRPNSIVITTDDYTRLREDHGALRAVVESLMMTSHLMFVGFSMGDPTFVDATKKVQAIRELAQGKRPTDVGTVLALDERAVAKHPDFKVVPMLDHEDHEDHEDHGEAARRLEIFLDRLSWKATTEGPASNAYLLHPNYKDLFKNDPTTVALRRLHGSIVNRVSPGDAVWATKGWKQLADLLSQLGDDRFGDKVKSKGAFPVNPEVNRRNQLPSSLESRIAPRRGSGTH
jgi:hypothetical protein